MMLPTFNHEIINQLIYDEYLQLQDLSLILDLNHQTLEEDLLNLIHFYIDNIKNIEDNEVYSTNAMLYSLFILQEINAKNKLHLILNIIELDDAILYYFFGDRFTEYVWSLLVFFGENQLEVLKESLKNKKSHDFSNEQIAYALVQLFLRNKEKQELINSYWTELLEYYNSLDSELENFGYTYLTFFCAYIVQPSEYQISLIHLLHVKNCIDKTVFGTFDKLINYKVYEGDLITVFDVYYDIEDYRERIEINENIRLNNKNKATMLEELNDLYMANHNLPIINTQPKVNRNDNCPCGSGKKYKKCCINE